MENNHLSLCVCVCVRVCTSVCLAIQIRACAARSCQIVPHHLRLNELPVISLPEDICVSQWDASEVGAPGGFPSAHWSLHSALSAPPLLMFDITSHAPISVTLFNPPLIGSGWIRGACYCRTVVTVECE